VTSTSRYQAPLRWLSTARRSTHPGRRDDEWFYGVQRRWQCFLQRLSGRWIGNRSHDITNGSVNIGFTDVPMSSAAGLFPREHRSELRPVPYALGGAVIGYNLGAGFDNLKLTAAEISAIYNGTITQWSDPTIVATNGGPARQLVRRWLPLVRTTSLATRSSPLPQRGSGTTEAFTYYLYQAGNSGIAPNGGSPRRDRANLEGTNLTASPTTREWLRVLSTRSDRLVTWNTATF